MSSTMPSSTIAAASRDEKEKPKPKRMWRGFLRELPTFFYLLVFYLVIELLSSDVRATVFSIGKYAFTWVEVLYIAAFMLAIIELLRVSHPGVDNIYQALFMLGAGVAYLALFLLGAAGVRLFSIFSNFEFLMLLLISSVQVVMGFILNSRTLKVTIQEK